MTCIRRGWLATLLLLGGFVASTVAAAKVIPAKIEGCVQLIDSWGSVEYSLCLAEGRFVCQQYQSPDAGHTVGVRTLRLPADSTKMFLYNLHHAFLAQATPRSPGCDAFVAIDGSCASRSMQTCPPLSAETSNLLGQTNRILGSKLWSSEWSVSSKLILSGGANGKHAVEIALVRTAAARDGIDSVREVVLHLAQDVDTMGGRPAPVWLEQQALSSESCRQLLVVGRVVAPISDGRARWAMAEVSVRSVNRLRCANASWRVRTEPLRLQW